LAAKLMSWITRTTVRPARRTGGRSARMICTAFHVEVVQRLVEQQDVRLLGNRHGRKAIWRWPPLSSST
jgi:hypothetical protein